MLGAAPWWRGPALLARRPGVALGLFVAALVAAAPLAALPMFTASASAAALQARAGDVCPWTLGSQVTVPVSVGPDGDAAGHLGQRVTAEADVARLAPALGPAAVTLFRNDLTLGAGGAAAQQGSTQPGSTQPGTPQPGSTQRGTTQRGTGQPITLASRTGFADQVSVVDGPRGAGVWLPDTLASRLGLSVGDSITLNAPSGVWSRPIPAKDGGISSESEPIVVPPMAMPVAAIYRDLRSVPASEFWCSSGDLYQNVPGHGGRKDMTGVVRDLVLVDQDDYLAVAHQAGLTEDQSGVRIERSVTLSGLTQARAESIGAQIEQMHQRIAQFTKRGGLFYHKSDPWEARSGLAGYAARSGLVADSVHPVALVISLAGVAVGLLVLIAAAMLWVQRRRRELTVLATHGVGPGWLGVKASLEALLPVLCGAGAGWAVAWSLVRLAGPSPLIDTRAVLAGAWAALVVAGVGLVVTALAAAVRCRELTDQKARRRHRLAVIPWELGLLGVAALAWFALPGGHLAALGSDTLFGRVAALPVRLLLAPLLAVTGVAALAGRVSGWWSGRSSAARSVTWLLIRRRLAHERRAVTVLAAATALPLGLALFGAIASDSTSATLAAQARLTLGSDTVVTLADRVPVPATLRGHATLVSRVDGIRIGATTADLLEVDPATFPQGAFWDSRLGGPDLASMMRELTGSADKKTGPIVLASAGVPAGKQTIADADGGALPVTVHAIGLLPGEQAGYAVVLVAPGTLRTLGLADRAHTQLWVRGAPTATRQAVVAAGLPMVLFLDADSLYAHTWIEPVTYTFDYLTGICLLVGLVATVGLVLYLEAGTPTRRRAWVILRRAGMRPAAHRRSLLAQTGIPVGVGLVIGLLVAIVVASLSRGDMDINPNQPPHTLLTMPGFAAAVIVLAVVAILVGTTVVGHLRTIQADPSEVLRDSA